MSELKTPLSMFHEEWAFAEDPSGVVYCLGKQIRGTTHEAVVVYEHMSDGSGPKRSLIDNRTYNRVMYHGFPEEYSKLQGLRPEIRASILGKLSLRDQCVYLDTASTKLGGDTYQSIEYWLDRTDQATAPFRKALEKTHTLLTKVGVQLETAQLYGGASFGLVDRPDKVVDDIDLLLLTDSKSLHEASQKLQTPYTWSEVNVGSTLSSRRTLLKAKRWSTSQMRILGPDTLTIDLKIKRDETTPSLWEDLPARAEFQPFNGKLKVIDDKETFCISPAIRCEDVLGQAHTVLFRGYPYIGCAIRNDIISIQGRIDRQSGTILVTQKGNDLLIPDFRNVPIS